MCYWTLVLYVQRSMGTYTLLEGTSPQIDSSAKIGKESILTTSLVLHDGILAEPKSEFRKTGTPKVCKSDSTT